MVDDAPRVGDVRRTYDRIADHFAATRAHPWDDVTDFLADRTGRVGVDLGCGNGRHAAPLADRVDRVLPLDLSWRMLAAARDRVGDTALCRGDLGTLPIATDAVDLGVCIASLHHLGSRDRRVAALSEMGRILAPDGRLLVSVWSHTHDRFDRAGAFDTTVDWTLPDGTVVGRFYHIYDRADLVAELDAAAADPVAIRESAGNLYAEIGPPG
ncbi:SAM-dependent methyltransferase [Halobacteriales archaeon SW_7_68_16]|nr:MAG: SAM-dependent methyltransferase [Halobacteriales archaeon SW_7_68_16]